MELDFSKLTNAEVTELDDTVHRWAERTFAAFPPVRIGYILDWCQELIDLRDEVDREVLWRAITQSPTPKAGLYDHHQEHRPESRDAAGDRGAS